MNLLMEMSNWKAKPKELVVYLTEKVEKDSSLFSQLIEILISGSNVEKGTAADIVKHVSKTRPEIVVPFIDDLLVYINHKTPRVKWGIPEAIGNMAQRFPNEVAKSVPYLLVNTKDKSTVVRWCAAFALTEIAKNNTEVRRDLVVQIEEMTKNEKNNGVKNVYLKALKTIGKQLLPKENS